MKQELMWEQPIDMEVEAAGRRPELRGDQEKKGHQTAMRASVGDWAAFLVKNDEGWMIAKLLPPRLCAVQMGKEVATMAKASNIWPSWGCRMGMSPIWCKWHKLMCLKRTIGWVMWKLGMTLFMSKSGSLELPKAVQGMNLLTVASGLRASVVTLGLLASK
jgi:hypothetical protein